MRSLYPRYQTLVQQSYVQATSRLRFCPHAGCSETLFCPAGYSSSTITDGVPIVRCGEGHEFCFGCGNDTNHRPLLCKFVQVWNKSAKEDAGTSQWLRANTKDCPKCHNNIEKAGGCKYVGYMKTLNCDTDNDPAELCAVTATTSSAGCA